MFELNIHPNELSLFKNKVHKCSQKIHKLIKNFIKQASYMDEYELPYSRNLMILYLEEIIIHLLQNNINQKKNVISNANPVQSQFENETVDEINAFIINNMNKNLTVGDLSEHFSLSRSSLQLLFKKHIGTTPKQYINNLKMKEAQKLISLNKYTITEIAHMLGFNSIHYFSSKFKNHFGIPPSEYSKSILTRTHK